MQSARRGGEFDYDFFGGACEQTNQTMEEPTIGKFVSALSWAMMDAVAKTIDPIAPAWSRIVPLIGAPPKPDDTKGGKKAAAAAVVVKVTRQDLVDQPFLRPPIYTYRSQLAEPKIHEKDAASLKRFLRTAEPMKKEESRVLCGHIRVSSAGDILGPKEMWFEVAPEESRDPMSAFTYLFDRYIGGGTEGSVFAVRRMSDDRPFALKYCTFDHECGIRSQVATFAELKEVMMALETNWSDASEHVSPICSISLTPSMKLILRTPLYGHRTLQCHMAGGIKHAIQCTRQILDALAFMHGSRVAHLDLKPSNIMVESVNPIHLRLVDLGFARVFRMPESEQRLPMTAAKVASPCYRAPEVFREDMDYTEAVDIWSVGCILFEMIMERTAFDVSPSPLEKVPDEPMSSSSHARRMTDQEREYKSDRPVIVSIYNEFRCGTEPGADFSTIFRPEVDTSSSSKDIKTAAVADVESEKTQKRPHVKPVMIKPQTDTPLRNAFLKKAGTVVADLLAQMWTFDPSNRPSASKLLNHPAFSNGDEDDAADLPTPLTPPNQTTYSTSGRPLGPDWVKTPIQQANAAMVKAHSGTPRPLKSAQTAAPTPSTATQRAAYTEAVAAMTKRRMPVKADTCAPMTM